jgi:hypothetical protein
VDNCNDHKDCIQTVNTLQLSVNTHNEKLSQAEVRLHAIYREIWEGDRSIISRIKTIEVNMGTFSDNLVRATKQLDTITERVLYGAAIFSLVMPIVSGVIIGLIIHWIK